MRWGSCRHHGGGGGGAPAGAVRSAGWPPSPFADDPVAGGAVFDDGAGAVGAWAFDDVGDEFPCGTGWSERFAAVDVVADLVPALATAALIRRGNLVVTHEPNNAIRRSL
jgi:hypothetical protein